jgi:hypothetical protein
VLLAVYVLIIHILGRLVNQNRKKRVLYFYNTLGWWAQQDSNL